MHIIFPGKATKYKPDISQGLRTVFVVLLIFAGGRGLEELPAPPPSGR